MSDLGALSLALLRSCGIPTDDAISVDYSHEVGRLPEITVVYVVTHPVAGFVETVTQVYEMVQESCRG